MVGATETEREEKGQVPPELNSFEFFSQALSYFEGEANGKLSSEEQSPTSLVESSNSIFEINAIKTIILQDDWENKTREESTSTPERPSGPLLEERVDINAIELNNIIGTNSSLTSDYQMSDPNLKWLKHIIVSKPNIKEMPKLDKKDPNTIIKKEIVNTVAEFANEKGPHLFGG